MTESVSTALIAAAAGLLSGTIASLLAPWAQWGVERRRARLEARRSRINEWRNVIGGEGFGIEQFRTSAAYASLRPHLSNQIVQWIESQTITVRVGSGRHGGVRASASELLDEITRIEREWELI